jgi:hypothetical protein
MDNDRAIDMAIELDMAITDLFVKNISSTEFHEVRDNFYMDAVPYLKKNQDNKELLSKLEELRLDYLFYQ